MAERDRLHDLRRNYISLRLRTCHDPIGLLIENQTPLPKSLGIIMDGNGRWAQHHRVSVPEGHKAGAKRMADIFEACYRLPIDTIVVWAMSPDNFEKRDPAEIQGLMGLTLAYLQHLLPEFHENGVQFVHLGRKEGLPAQVITALEAAECETKENTKQKIALALNYDGRIEALDGIRRTAEAIARGELLELTDETLAPFLDPYNIGLLDMLIRTSGQMRPSGIGRIANNAEWFFSPKRLCRITHPVIWPWHFSSIHLGT